MASWGGACAHPSNTSLSRAATTLFPSAMSRLTLFVPLGGILLTWLLLYGVLVGVGLSAQRWLARRGAAPERRSVETLSDAFWLGYAVVLLALQVWHLMRPGT